MPFQPLHISAIPSTTDYLFNLFTTTCPYDADNEPIMVWFGSELGVWSSPTTIEINGIDPVTREWASMGPDYRIEEHFCVKCKITVFSGQATTTQNFLDTKNSVFTTWFALETAVANDPTLGGNVRLTSFDEVIYEPAVDGGGRAMGTITWCVKCEARIFTLS